MDIRLAKKDDLNDLKEIWKLSFGDTDSFIDFYFQAREWTTETAVLAVDGKVVSMLTMVPVDMVEGNGDKFSTSMLYAIATHPGFQKRGFAGQLISFSNEYLRAKQVSATLLVPASEELFRFYGRQGYRNGFFIREAVLSRKEIETSGMTQEEPCRITAAEPAEYNRVRRKMLNGRAYLDYRDGEILFEKRLARMFETDLYTIVIGGTEGCAYAERISQEEVIIKELLMPDQYLMASLLSLSGVLPAEKYIVRTPSRSGEILGGAVRPFGMLRINGIDGRPLNTGNDASDAGCRPAADSYLGIAYD